MEKQPCVYILCSQPYGTLYIGVTSNLLGRLWQHRSGEVKGFTSRYRVHRLVRFELAGSMIEAIEREKQLKRWHRQWKVNLIESKIPTGMILRQLWGFRRWPSPAQPWMLKQVQHDKGEILPCNQTGKNILTSSRSFGTTWEQ